MTAPRAHGSVRDVEAAPDVVRVYAVAGMSMYPLYRDGDLVAGTDFNGTAKCGRCYGFANGNGRLLHRFVGLRSGLMFFSGDDSAGFESAEPGDIFFSADTTGPPVYNLTVRVINELFFRYHIAGGQSSKIKSAIIRAVYKVFFAGVVSWRRKKST